MIILMSFLISEVLNKEGLSASISNFLSSNLFSLYMSDDEHAVFISGFDVECVS